MLPFGPPLSPMLGVLADDLPEGEGWSFEPKWDGFRAVVFRDGDALEIRSRDDRPLLRYFPELAGPLRDALPEAAVVDGEIVIAHDGALDFDALQLRLHPAASRIQKLAKEIPASIVAWDLLALGDRDLRELPFSERARLLDEHLRPGPSVLRSPTTTDREVARDWFRRFQGAGFDGVMAKRLADPYLPNKRAMVKVKHVRTIDAAVLGFRWQKGARGEEVGSLVLGLYDEEGQVRPIGVASSFSKKERQRLKEVLTPLIAADEHPWATFAVPGSQPGDGAEHERRPDLHSRWNAGKDLSWEPVRPGPVVEVSTTQHNTSRLRHPAKVVRWRPDRDPRSCRTDQLDIAVAPELSALFHDPPTPPGA